MSTLLINEIQEQPLKWKEFVHSQGNKVLECSQFLVECNFDLVAFLARGSSEYASLIGHQLIQNKLHKPTTVVNFSTLTMFGYEIDFRNSLGIAISQSGESEDLIANVSQFSKSGSPVIGISNNEDSTLSKLVDKHIYLSAGDERSVAATKTYTLEILAQWLLLNSDEENLPSLINLVETVSESAEQIIKHQVQFQDLVEPIVNAQKIIVVGRGWGVATAKEAALKIVETTGKSASGWSINDAIHGPLGQIDSSTLVLLVEPEMSYLNLVEPLVLKVKEQGGGLVSLNSNNQYGVYGPLGEMLNILPIQIACNYASIALGRNPDKPAGLTKVTMTR